MKRINHTSIIRGRGGFSVAELMVVLGIAGVLATIAIPAFTSWVPNYKLKVATGEITAALQFAKLSAVKESANVVVWFNTANNTFRAFLDNGDGGGTSGNNTQDGGEQTLKEGTLDSVVNMYSTVFSTWANQTVFNSRGLASGGWGYVYLRNDNSQYRRVTLWTTGHIKTEKSTDGATWS